MRLRATQEGMKERESSPSSDPGEDDEVWGTPLQEDVRMDFGGLGVDDDLEIPPSEPYAEEQASSIHRAHLSNEGNDVITEEFDGAAQVIGEGDDIYTNLWRSDEHYASRKSCGPYYPFSGEVEWEMVQWLHSLNASIDEINQFFKLKYVSTSAFETVF